MSGSADAQKLHLGFLKVITIDSAYVGGLLVTNRQGRPLEFQCTTPVRPNRTQEILYGPTLPAFISAELVGKTLVERLSVKAEILVIHQEMLLDLRSHVEVPVACVIEDSPASRKVTGTDLADGTRIQLGRQLVRFHPDFPQDHTQFDKRLSLVPSDADLLEPLERVEEALKETMRAGAVA